MFAVVSAWDSADERVCRLTKPRARRPQDDPSARGAKRSAGPEAGLGAELTSRGRRTRQALRDAARKVFERDGFVGARVTDIAATAGVAHGTFYRYFDSKEAVFRDVITDVRDEILTFVDQYPSDEESATPLVIERAHLRYLATYRDNAVLIELWNSVAAMDEDVSKLLLEARQVHVARVERTIRTLQLHGLADTELDPRGAAHAIAGMLTRFAGAWFAQGDARELDEGARQLTRLWTNAVGLVSARTDAQESVRHAQK